MALEVRLDRHSWTPTPCSRLGRAGAEHNQVLDGNVDVLFAVSPIIPFLVVVVVAALVLVLLKKDLGEDPLTNLEELP